MLDCTLDIPTINRYALTTRPRSGWEGYDASPFGYKSNELSASVMSQFPDFGDMPTLPSCSDPSSSLNPSSASSSSNPGPSLGFDQRQIGNGDNSSAQLETPGKGVLQTNWGWRRVAVNPDWRFMRDTAEEISGGNDQPEARAKVGLANGRMVGETRKRRGSWWGDDEGCVVM